MQLYADEDFAFGATVVLRPLGHDVLTAQEDNRRSIPDVDILARDLEAVLFVNRFKVPNPRTPKELIGRDFEDVTFTTADHLQIRGWFLPARNAPSKRTLLICHGLGANRFNFLPFVEIGDVLDAAVGPKTLWIADTEGHGGALILARSEYLAKVKEWMAMRIVALINHSSGTFQTRFTLPRDGHCVHPPTMPGQLPCLPAACDIPSADRDVMAS